jgi:hypothetical protein
MRGVARDLQQAILGSTRPAVLTFAAAAALLLIIACLNAANPFSCEVPRFREMAVRSRSAHPVGRSSRNCSLSMEPRRRRRNARVEFAMSP